MRQTIEQRQQAVAEALRALAAEPVAAPLAEPAPAEAASAPAAGTPVMEAVVDAVGPRLDALSGQLREVLARLDSVETALLESVWEQPAPSTEAMPQVSRPTEPFPVVEPAVAVVAVPVGEAEEVDGDSVGAADPVDDGAPAVTVPAIALGEGRMSSAAAQALFGH